MDTLPGLDLTTATSPGALVTAARATIEALHRRNLLTEEHTLACTLVLQLAQAADRGLAEHRVSVATATVARQLQDALDSLPTTTVETGGTWEKLQAEFAKLDDPTART